MGGTWSITADESSQLPVPTDAVVNASIPLPENSIEYVRVLPLVVMERVTWR